ncbi:outer membrane protein [Salidesulfovibrio brasiliensis]|uniref:outer membrane protein n=1 Tax=Salidesulfovibrio brasiliensis TaxID=221711 RepID=UPI0006D20364|nr:outer membrane beta-barrel protein [Salidesulfovibrio brasiliensis]
MRVYATLFFLCLFTVLFSATALAGEASSPPSVDWSKPYVGIAIGAAYGEADHGLRLGGTYFNKQDSNQIDPLGSRDQSEVMPAVSVFAGFNHQWDNLVLGLEGEFTYAPFEKKYDTGRTEYESLPANYFNMRSRVTSDWMASLKPRLGYAFDNSLAYITAGPALSEIKYHFHFDDDNLGGNSATVDKEKLCLGWIAGIGYDHMLENGWGIRASYQHYEFPDIADSAPSFTNGAFQGDFSNSLDYKSDVFLLGIFKTF